MSHSDPSAGVRTPILQRVSSLVAAGVGMMASHGTRFDAGTNSGVRRWGGRLARCCLRGPRRAVEGRSLSGMGKLDPAPVLARRSHPSAGSIDPYRTPRSGTGQLGDLVEETLPGWTPRAADPWMYREPGRCAVEPPPGVTVAAVQDPLLFERTAFLAASGQPPQRAGELHPPGSQHHAGLHLYVAWRAARAVGTALAVVHRTGVAVSAVAVLASERRQGIGAALTAAALRTASELPATLSTSQIAAPTYRRLGFVEVGTPVDWAPHPRHVMS